MKRTRIVGHSSGSRIKGTFKRTKEIFLCLKTKNSRSEVKIHIFELNNTESSQKMNSSAVRALALEYKSLHEDPVEGFRVKLLNDENLFEWTVSRTSDDNKAKKILRKVP